MTEKQKAELARLNLHAEILRGKLALPSNDATRASLMAHLARLESRIARTPRAAVRREGPARYADLRGKMPELWAGMPEIVSTVDGANAYISPERGETE